MRVTRNWAWALFALALVYGLQIFGCSSNGSPETLGDFGPTNPNSGTGSCHDGVVGCPCGTANAVADCGRTILRNGDYETCSMGHSTCDGTKWSACVGNRIVVQSLVNRTLGSGGIQIQSVPTTCDPCDPYCQTTPGDPTQIGAPGFTVTDASVTLAQGEAGTVTQCTGLQCLVPVCGGNTTTKISGVVYDPAGVNPIYNAFVYIPLDATGTLQAFSQGATCDTCAGTNLHAVAVTQTAADGTFTLTNIPAGTNIPLVVQIGKWRREIMLSTVTKCIANPVANNCTAADKTLCVTRLPKNQTDGYNAATGLYNKADMPKIAMVTGSADPFECMLLKAGIDPNEFGSVTTNSSRRIHFYSSPDSPGTVLNTSYGAQVTGDVLWNNAATMATYDAIIYACEGSAIDKKQSVNPPPNGVSPYKNLINYTNAGGRIFATHYSYVWLQYPNLKDGLTAWNGSATWIHSTGSINTQDPLNSTITTSFAKGAAFSSWLENVGASTTAAPSTAVVAVHEGRQDLTTVGASSQGWMTATDTNNGTVSQQNFVPHFTFNTPYGAAAASQCGRVVFSDFHVSANALIDDSTNQCFANGDCGFTATCNGAVVTTGSCSEPCANNSDCFDSSYTCTGATQGTCQPAACSGSVKCSKGKCVSNKCMCTKDSQCGSGNCTIPNGQNSGTCDPQTCFAASDCGKSETCSGGAVLGKCGKSCTTSANCTAGETCVAGKCTGCTSSSNCKTSHLTSTCSGGSSIAGSCSPSNDSSTFPQACQQGSLFPQEKALEFMFFDLTACVTPDAAPPPVPSVLYQSASFTQDYTAVCATGTHVRWREVDWQASIPNTASVDLSAQSGGTTSTLLPATPVTIAHATTSTTLPGYDIGLIDTGATGTGAFNKASPPVTSDAVIRLTVTLNPTSDATAAPTLSSWRVLYDCEPAL